MSETEDRLLQAARESIDEERRDEGIATRAVLIYEWLDEDGDRRLGIDYSENMTLWDVLGMIRYAETLNESAVSG